MEQVLLFTANYFPRALLLLLLYSAVLFSVDALGEIVEYLFSVVKEGLEALYWLSMHDLLFKMVPLNNCFNAVVDGAAGSAMAGPLFLPEMVLAGPHFWPRHSWQGCFLTFLLDLL